MARKFDPAAPPASVEAKPPKVREPTPDVPTASRRNPIANLGEFAHPPKKAARPKREKRK